MEVELDQRIAEAVSGAFVLNLGGARGAGEGWGQCLAVRVDPPSTLSSIRSQLGNALANKAQLRGLRAVGAVVYIEVTAARCLHSKRCNACIACQAEERVCHSSHWQAHALHAIG